MTNPVRKHYSITIKDLYKEYKDKKKEEGFLVSEIIPYKKYRKIVEKFFAGAFEKMIKERAVLLFPYKIGTFLIVSSKLPINQLPVDYNETIKHGRVMRHTNTHTHGYCFRIKWNNDVSLRNKSVYQFSAIRSKYALKHNAGKKALARHIKELSKDPTRRSFAKI